MTVRRFNSLLLLALLTVSGSSSTKVVGRAGEDVTLSCKYDIKKHGPTAACWGRGPVSTFGCNNQIISTDGYKVTTRAPSRYQLLGRLEDGDVSLTILKTTEEDAGLYGCRVKIDGPFNDESHHIDLSIEKAPSTSSTPTTETTEQTPQTEQTINTSGQVTVTESVQPSSDSNDPEQQQDKGKKQTGIDVIIILVCVLLVLVGLVTAGVTQHEEEQQTYTSVWYSCNSSTLELRRRVTTVRNIYQIDCYSEAVYEVCLPPTACALPLPPWILLPVHCLPTLDLTSPTFPPSLTPDPATAPSLPHSPCH
ncbi:hepatitis A virus cellular receptor 1 homolog [Scomber japonicus]|uniref:hepatitis A virus cellular receptor 1 homolog n=1 Tax=Scomber japonicus TaxID=13676 RepID=UPI002304E7AC|nr:hepatitis A virus cellular receptor 1 homolog [Scomber japonicus]